MKRTLLYLLFLGFGTALYAQTINTDSIFEPKLRGEFYRAKTGIEGNQYYNNEWTISDIKLGTGEMVFDKQLKYDVMLDEVIWLQPNSFGQVKLEKHFIDEVYFHTSSGEPILFRRIRAKLPPMPDTSDIFVEVLVEKKASLFVFRTVRAEGSVNNINGVERYFVKLVPEPKYIIVFPDRQTLVLKKISKRVLAKALPEKYKIPVKEIILTNHLRVRNETDLAKVIGMVEK